MKISISILCLALLVYNSYAQTNSVDTLETVVLQSFNYKAQPAEVPAAVSFLSKADLVKFGANDFVAAVNTVAGVKMDERSIGSYRLAIRGNVLRSTFGVRNVKVYWNGIPFTDANGNTYLNQIELQQIGSMEILKGPSGSMYGAGTGGVVLLQSEKSKTPGSSFKLRSSLGSYGTFSGGGSYSLVKQKAEHKFGFNYRESDGYRDNSNLIRRVGDYNGRFTIDAKQELNVHLFYSNLFYQTPGGLTLAELRSNPRNARPNATTQKAALHLKTFYAGFSYNYQINERLNSLTGVYISHTKFKNPTFRNYETKTEQGAGGRWVLTYEHNRLKLQAGTEFQQSFTNAGVYGNRSGVRDTLQVQDEISSQLLNVFAQADYNAKSWLFTAGLSYNHSGYDFLRVSIPTFETLHRNFDPDVIPRIAVRKSVGKHLNVYASFSKGFSTPSIDEVYASDVIFNTNLNAEQGTNYEIGFKLKPINNKFWGEVAVYYFRLDETIVSRTDSTGGDYYVNAGKTKQLGIESALNYVLINNNNPYLSFLKFWNSLTVTNARFKNYNKNGNDFNNNKLTGMPNQVVQTGVEMKLFKEIKLNVSHAYTGAVPLNDANTVFAEHYNRVFVNAQYNLKLLQKYDVICFVSWERSFNNPYGLGNDLNAALNRYYNPSAPWMFTAGIELNIR